MKLVFILIFISNIAYSQSSKDNSSPFIEVSGTSSRLHLTPDMNKELKTKAPSFKQYPPKHFPADITKDYKFNKNQMMSAVLGDFNGDGSLDALVQGSDDEGDVIYFIHSSGSLYFLSEFGSRHGGMKTIPSLYNEKSVWKYGMKYLSYNGPGHYFTGQTYKGKKDQCPLDGVSVHANADGNRTFFYCFQDGKLTWDGDSGD